ncbi:hypothetical protein SLS64_007922 [Diaporthe eres]|uniref:Ankyrin repeat containing protein n=1 Tax=Diaporthe eres TaxID=83184 RepID=A0ABR1PG40_DIAER
MATNTPMFSSSWVSSTSSATESDTGFGVVEVLITDHDASLFVARRRSSKLFKKVAGIDQTDILHSTDLLSQAVQHCHADIVATLLQHADIPSRSKALPVAMRTNDPVKVQFVMAAGANAAPLCEEFQTIVQSGSFEMMHALVVTSKTRGPCESCLNVALLHAVNQGCLRRTQSLIHNGADVTSHGSGALLVAVQNGRADLVKVLTTELPNSSPKASPRILDNAVELAYHKVDGGQGVDANYHVLELCLAAGASGKGTSRTLAKAIRHGQFDILDMYAKQNVPAFEDEGAGMAIIHAAIATERSEIVKTILSLRHGPSRNQKMGGITQAVNLQNQAAGLVIAGLFLQSGLHGDTAVSEALVSSIRLMCNYSSQGPVIMETYHHYYAFVKLFLDQGAANVGHHGGESILLAAGSGLIDVLGLLIHRRQSAATLNKAVARAMALQDGHTRYATVKMLLNAGAQGPLVGEALTQSAGMGHDHVNLTSMILPYSSVDIECGKPLVSAVRSGCFEQVNTLVTLGKPSHATITAAWVKVQTVPDAEFQMMVYQLFLKSGKVDQFLCDQGLVGAAGLGRRGKRLCELMLKHGGSPARLGGQAIAVAAKHFFFDIVEMLSCHVDSQEVYTAAFDALAEDTRWLMPGSDGLSVAELLLQKGASGKVVDSAFCQAARNHVLKAVELLCDYVGTEAFGLALLWASSDPAKAAKDEALELISKLLESGAGSESANEALLRIVGVEGVSRDIIETLMTNHDGHADVNYQDGESLKLAIRCGNPDILDDILNFASQTGCTASRGAMTEAFAEALTTDQLKDDSIVLKMLDVLVKPRGGAPLPDVLALVSKCGNWAPVFSCVAMHPNSPLLVKKLAEIGCDIKVETYLNLYDDEEVQAEPANALLWALCWAENRISLETIEALIENGADVNYTSKISAATPLILAAKYDRGDVVAKLIDEKARVSVKDRFGRSALFYASRVGNVLAMKALIKAKSRVNDGSLQEAARNLHSEAVQLLRKAGHSSNYPSSDKYHDGRDSLQELALMARPSQSQAGQLEDTIKALASIDKEDKIEVLRDSSTSGHKNALFLALDNQDDGCWLVCKALLDVVMWKVVDKEANTYCVLDPETGVKHYLSPTMYIKMGLSYGQEKHKGALLKLLYRMRCADRFYAEYGREQPPGVVGMPEHIAKEELKRKEQEQKLIQEDEKHKRAMMRKEHEADAQREMERLHHEEKLLHQREMEEQKRQQAEFTHAQKRMHTADSHQQKLEMQAQMEQSQQRWAMEKAKFEETKKMRMNALSESKIQREHAMKINFEKNISAQKEARQQRQNMLAQQAAKRKLQEAKKMQSLKSSAEKQKLAFKKRQNDQMKGLMRAQISNKRQGHDLQMEKVHADQQTLKMKAAMKYFDEKNRKRIGV